MLLQWDSDLTYGNTSAPFIGGLTGVPNFFRKPYVEQRVNYYIGEMVEKYTSGSERLETWFDLEARSNRRVSINPSRYLNFNNSRVNYAMNSEIGIADANTRFTVNGPSSTAADIIDLRGTSNHRAFDIRVVDRPDVEVQFTGQTEWAASGIYLRQGRNELEFQALDSEGLVVGTDVVVINKAGNAPPVVVLDSSPSSLNVPVQSTLVVDGGASFDPEGTNLSYRWEVDGDAILENPSPEIVNVRFPRPGLYLLTVTVEDQDATETVTTREITVYSESEWHPFSDQTLGEGWVEENVEVRHDYSGSAWYSLNDRPGELTLKLNDDSAKSMRTVNPQYPVLWRDLAGAEDVLLQTDLSLSSIQQGGFIAGLIVRVIEDGQEVTYAFGMENGDFLRARKIVGTTETRLGSVTWGEGAAVVRMRRVGSALHFDYRVAQEHGKPCTPRISMQRHPLSAEGFLRPLLRPLWRALSLITSWWLILPLKVLRLRTFVLRRLCITLLILGLDMIWSLSNWPTLAAHRSICLVSDLRMETRFQGLSLITLNWLLEKLLWLLRTHQISEKFMEKESESWPVGVMEESVMEESP